MRRVLLTSVMLASLLFPGRVSANGSYSHVAISQVAFERLPVGELRTTLEAERLAFEAGSAWPDSGYAANDDYGEASHWEPFVNAYVAYLQAQYCATTEPTVTGCDYSSAAAQRSVAFLMGAASHGMADQTYDVTILERAFEVDPGDPGTADTVADYFLVYDQGTVISIDDEIAPYADMVSIMPGVVGGSYTLSLETAEGGMSTMAGVIGLQQALGAGAILSTWEAFPYLGTFIYDDAVPGSVPHLGGVVADYWEALYARLHGEDVVNDDLVIASVPADGAVNFEVDLESTEVLTRLGLHFSEAVRVGDIGDRVTLSPSAGGEAIALRARGAYGGTWRKFVYFEPQTALAYDTEYDVVLDAAGDALTTMSGNSYSGRHMFSFRTRCAPGALDACPPLRADTALPPPWDRDAGAPEPEEDAGAPIAGGGATATAGGGSAEGGGGCATMPSSGAPPAWAWLLFVAGAWIWSRRLRVMRLR